MRVLLGLSAFRWIQTMLETKLARATDLKSEPNVALVRGGAILGFDNEVHIDLDRAHTVLSPDEARRFAIRLETIAATIEYASCPASAIEASETELVRRFSQIDGYRCLSLIRALAVVNCQSALA
jgi:hypothetical protein